MKPFEYRGIPENRNLPQNQALDLLKKEGKFKDGFIYGDLSKHANGDLYIIGELVETDEEYTMHEFWFKIIPETLGVKVGDFYVGDILESREGYTSFDIYAKENDFGIIEFVLRSYNPFTDNYDYYPIDKSITKLEKIGTIHDHFLKKNNFEEETDANATD